MNSSYRNVIIGSAAVVLLFVGLLWVSAPKKSAGNSSPQVASAQAISGSLSAEETSFDFGTVSMKNGKVNHVFKIKNDTDSTAVVSKLFTSCMCTTASISVNGTKKGPFGMPGHGFVPSIKGEIRASGSADVEVVFDPAAHGPAGVGRIDRVVYLEEKSGNKLELQFTAMVTP